MKKTGHLKILSSLVILLVGAAAQAQPAGAEKGSIGNDPVYVIQTLMNKNYMDIRSLHVPIMNYGGGQREFSALLDSYSRALSLYLQKRNGEAAELFRKNEQEVQTVATRLAQKYREDTEKLYALTVRMYVGSKMKRSLEGRNAEIELSLFGTGDTYISNASDSIRMANRYLETGRPVEAVYYYRTSKVYCFDAFDNYRAPVPDLYRLDLADNRNVIFTGPGKEAACAGC